MTSIGGRWSATQEWLFLLRGVRPGSVPGLRSPIDTAKPPGETLNCVGSGCGSRTGIEDRGPTAFQIVSSPRRNGMSSTFEMEIPAWMWTA